MRKLIKNRGAVHGSATAWAVLNQTVSALQPFNIFVLVDENSMELCLPRFLKNLQFQVTPQILKIKAGERHKNIETCLQLWNELSAKGANRSSLVINLGGGVLTDLGGFVASTFMRGIEFINIPTTLLAMVDASVGGKNGIDLGYLKNQIGTIVQPLMVLIDVEFLKTLPPAQIDSGRAEMFKHGLIHSEKYWDEVTDFDLSDAENTERLIWESIEIKNQIVTEDPFERKQRKTLNYGHTLGHAIESHFMADKQKTALLHGEAVAVGMILATFISKELLGFPEQKLSKATKTLFRFFQKIDFSEKDVAAIINLLVFDKKNSGGKVRFVLLKDFGLCETDCEVPNTLIYKAFEYYKKFPKN